MTGSEKHAGHRPDGNSSGGMSDVAEYLRNETVGGVLLILATVAALLWANLDYDNYEAFRNITVGPESLHLDLTLETWAKDGLLAVFFFIAGLELKRELVVGELREIRRAMLPLFGALGGMILPAIVFIIVARGTDGWTSSDGDAALRATRPIGNSFYGVDVKEKDGKGFVIEVNDNPNVDRGVEDKHLGMGLYRKIIGTLLKRMEARRGH